MPSNKVVGRSKNEHKKKLILDAAAALFIERDHVLISMDLIAKKAGVSKQTIYSHFCNKDELFVAAIRCKCEAYQMLDLLTENILDLRRLLIDIGTRFIDMVTSKEAMAIHRICSYQSENYRHLSQLYYDVGPKRVTKEVEKVMSRLSDEGYLSIDNAYYAALQFLHLVKGEYWLQEEFNTYNRISDREKKRYIGESVDMFLRAYAT